MIPSLFLRSFRERAPLHRNLPKVLSRLFKKKECMDKHTGYLGQHVFEHLGEYGRR